MRNKEILEQQGRIMNIWPSVGYWEGGDLLYIPQSK